MDSQIKGLIEKYWNGETDLNEEKQVREYFRTHDGSGLEDQFFNQLASQQQVVPEKAFRHPGQQIRFKRIIAAAAAIIILFTVSVWMFPAKPDKFAVNDPAEAFEITKASLQMVSNGLNKGKTYSNELAKFNEAKTIIKNQ